MRLLCLSPLEKGVVKKVSTMSLASSVETILAPKQMILASLCSLVSLAEVASEQQQALMPLCLLQAMEMPTPVPQMAMPRSTSLFWMALANTDPASG